MAQPTSANLSPLRWGPGYSAQPGLQRDDSEVVRSPHATGGRSTFSVAQDAVSDSFRMRSKPATPRAQLPTHTNGGNVAFALPNTGLRVRTAFTNPGGLLSPRRLKARQQQRLLHAAAVVSGCLLLLLTIIAWHGGAGRRGSIPQVCELSYTTLLAQQLADSALAADSSGSGSPHTAARVAIVSFHGWRSAHLRPQAAAFAGVCSWQLRW